ncbi:bidirectional sugar transporter SWEET17-like [Ipomoea triloba]|uniref:bidirectional sugar transporter SWEET17-like n=1 Tax=Ipomoea triloba TaxID=35885 RepID=UPI00125DA7C1|nr:bidirectional sugar transporter SWEET17-like [Ipomoea triloba]
MDLDLSFYVGVVGNILSIFIFLSPVDVFIRIVKNRSTEDFDSTPYISALLNSSFWCYYGLTKPGAFLVFTVNAFGVVAEAVYVLIFIVFAPPKTKNKTAALAAALNIGLLAVVVLVTKITLEGESLIDAIGFVCIGLNIIMYASPLAAMGTVLRTKSVEFMPFYLSLFICLNAGVWAVYAFIVRDWFLGVPNGTGFIFGAVQLILYAIYSKPKTAKSSTAVLEDSMQNEPLLSA